MRKTKHYSLCPDDPTGIDGRGPGAGCEIRRGQAVYLPEPFRTGRGVKTRRPVASTSVFLARWLTLRLSGLQQSCCISPFPLRQT